VVAKVTRDRIMTAMDARYPAYGFAAHKGYSTRVHMSALGAHGPCPEHRFSFANVAGAMEARAAARDGTQVRDEAPGRERPGGREWAAAGRPGR